ncbi:MAG TPA: cytochrome c biogenesis protein ResB [Mycobacteriales bacterium]|nr:cytochrome c biogenesis protein ResB [Mycobacteriales bacterium]
MTVVHDEVETAEGGRLSTQPDPVAPRAAQSSRLATARWLWRRLTSMRTALVLLFLLAVAAVPGSLLPQRSNDLARVDDYLARHGALARFMDRIWLFDVFTSPWFAAVYLLLVISLLGCLVPRWSMHARAMLRRPPRTPARLSRLPQHATFSTPLPVDAVVAAAQRTLRRRRFRTIVDDGDRGRGRSVSAEKGYLRETGNLFFHMAIVALLFGVAYGSLYGYRGDRVLVEAQVADPAKSSAQALLTDTQGQYDDFSAGRLVDTGNLAPWTVRLDSFVATYQSGTTTPKRYDAHMSYRTSPTAPWQTDDIRVNHPLHLGATKVYLLNHGYAPVFQLVSPDGKKKYTQSVVCPTLSTVTLISHCAVVFADLPDKSPSHTLGFDVTFLPTAQFVDGRPTSTSPQLGNPDAIVGVYSGDLGLGRAHSVYSLNTAHAQFEKTGNIVLLSKDPAFNVLTGLPGGWTLQIPAVGQWASFQVKRDPGKLVVLLAAATMILGILTSLRVRRRRVWLRATPGEEGSTLVEVGGLARTDADGFAEEFEGLVQRLTVATTPSPGRKE